MNQHRSVVLRSRNRGSCFTEIDSRHFDTAPLKRVDANPRRLASRIAHPRARRVEALEVAAHSICFSSADRQTEGE